MNLSVLALSNCLHSVCVLFLLLAYVFVMVSIILIIIDNIPYIGPVRATEQEELDCDRVVTGESAYILSADELRALLEAAAWHVPHNLPYDPTLSSPSTEIEISKYKGPVPGSTSPASAAPPAPHV